MLDWGSFLSTIGICHITAPAPSHRTAAASLTVEVWDQPFPLAALKLSLFLTVVFVQGSSTVITLAAHYISLTWTNVFHQTWKVVNCYFNYSFWPFCALLQGLPLCIFVCSVVSPGALELSSSFFLLFSPPLRWHTLRWHLPVTPRCWCWVSPVDISFQFYFTFNSRISIEYFPIRHLLLSERSSCSPLRCVCGLLRFMNIF